MSIEPTVVVSGATSKVLLLKIPKLFFTLDLTQPNLTTLPRAMFSCLGFSVGTTLSPNFNVKDFLVAPV